MTLRELHTYPDTPALDTGLDLRTVPGVHERSWCGDAFLLQVEKGLIIPSEFVGDIGTGKGCIGLYLATQSAVSDVLLTDKNEVALAIAERNAETNGLRSKCAFSTENAWGNEARTIVANLPQNASIEAYGEDGSTIQRAVIEELSQQNLVDLYVKDISYAASTVTQAYVTDHYNVQRIGRA